MKRREFVEKIGVGSAGLVTASCRTTCDQGGRQRQLPLDNMSGYVNVIA